MVHRTWTNDEIFEAVTEWVQTHGQLPTSGDWTFSGRGDYPTYQTIWSRWGSWDEFIRQYRIARHHWDREKIITAFQKWYEIYGEPPAIHQARSEIGVWLPRPSTVMGHFGKWNDAIRAAGFTPVPRGVTRKNMSKYMPLPRRGHRDD